MFKSLRYVLTIAGVERSLLYRTAKFWVLAGIGVGLILLFLLAMTLGSILDNSPPGEFLLEGTDAFLALYFFSYVQAILIIFVATDFRKLEEKNRLDQVMLSKPMTTANWVAGKYVGTVGALVYLNLFLILLAVVGRVFKVIFASAGFNILPFVEYFAIATLPSILFMTALVFFLVSLLRVQALAMLLPLGYVAAILFYFHHNTYGLFDYGCFFAPLFASDFIGFGKVTTILWQRLFFLLLAVSLVSFSVALYPRLRQSKWSHRVSLIAALLFLSSSAGVAYNIVKTQQVRQAIRQADLAAQQDRISGPTCWVSHYDLEVILGGEPGPLKVVAKLAVANLQEDAVRELNFALNGGLQISEVKWNDEERIRFVQEHQTVRLLLGDHFLQPGTVDTVQMSYAGQIEADAFMLDRLPEARGVINKRNGPWIKGAISAWVSKDFAVLPAQCGWYPIPGAAAGYPYSAPRKQNFSTANIRVRTDAALTTVTQGRKVEDLVEGGTRLSRFVVASPVPLYSLNVGGYRLLTREFGGVQLELYFREKHLPDYDLFAEVADTCYEAIGRVLELMQQAAGVPYPFPRLSFVETPTQMQVYTTRHGVDNVLLQPGIVMFDEVALSGKRLAKEIDRRTKRARRRGQDDSPGRVKRDVFIDAVLELLFPDRYWRDGSLISPMQNYIHFQMDIRDPLLSRALELYLYEAAERLLRDTFYPERWSESLSSNDRLRQNDSEWAVRLRYDVDVDTLLSALTETPLSELRPTGNGRLYRACVDFKGPPILKMLREIVGEKNFVTSMQQMLEEFRYRALTRADFLAAVQANSTENLHGFFRQWFDEATIPGYRITRAEAEKLDTGRMKVMYQVIGRVLNGEKGDGFVRVICKSENDKVGRSLRLGSYEEKEIHVPMADVPESIQVIPYFARNRGSIMKQVSIGQRIRRGIPDDTTFTVTSSSDSLSFVLDDQDEGFFTPVSEEARYLRPRSKGRSWWEDTNPFAYGRYYFGWRIKRAGYGAYPARWETTVPRTGEYELSFHLPMENSWVSDRLSPRFEITIKSPDGSHRIELEPHETAEGWLPLGRFRFVREEPAVVELADTGRGFVVADAIRWEFVE